MNRCCVNSGEKFFLNNYPFEKSIEQDDLLIYLKELCVKWGEITNFAINTNNFYIRTSSSPLLGIDAKTGILKCETCSKAFNYIFLGSRLYYFIWRMEMVCLTYWDRIDNFESGKIKEIYGSGNWPQKDQIDQLQIAIDMYFSNDSFLDTIGLSELNKKIFETINHSLVLHLYIIDLAELFVLFHELQHIIPISQFGIKGQGLHIKLPDNLDITTKRARNWTTEINCDANSLYLLYLSVFNVFNKKFNLSINDAKTQAASIVCSGADAAIQTLQTLEELRIGKVDLKDAVYRNEFVKHPPSEFRRTALSYASYSLVTGKSVDALFRKEFTASWKIVAQNVASHMKVYNTLLEKYNESIS